MGEYVSIKDFANRAGVSPQAIYQRLDKDLKQYFKVIEGKKSLDVKALELFYLKDTCKGFKDVEQDVEQGVDKSLSSALIEQNKTLQDTLRLLGKQLEIKDTQIAELNERLKEAQALNQNNQILLGAEQSRTNPAFLIGDTEAKSEVKPIEEQPARRKSFWSLFRKL